MLIVRFFKQWLLLLLLIGLILPSATPVATAPANVAPAVWLATEAGASTDFLVVLAEQADLTPAATLPTKAARGQWVYAALWSLAESSQAPLRAWLTERGIAHRPYYIVNALYIPAGERALVQALAARADVARIEANPRLRQLPFPEALSQPTAAQGVEWNLAQVGAPEVWAEGYTGAGIIIGGQDTGYDWQHPALLRQYRGWDGSAASHDYHWHDAIHSGGGVCGADSPVPCDDHSHGTHTMGIAVGDDGAGNQIGMAPGAQWIGCRNMDRGVGTPATYLECFEFFLAPYPVGGTPAQGDPARAPDVTINSWSCPASEGCSWETLEAAVNAQRAAGILTVVAAGNRGAACSTVLDPPAIYEAAYTVGAVTSGDLIASLSSRGPVTVDGSGRLKPDLVAPGVGVRSCVPGGGYGIKSGTSMAAPHVAGAAALLWSAQPALRDDLAATEALLNSTAVAFADGQCGDADAIPNNVYGWGRLDIAAAIAATHEVIEYPWQLFLPLVERREG